MCVCLVYKKWCVFLKFESLQFMTGLPNLKVYCLATMLACFQTKFWKSNVTNHKHVVGMLFQLQLAEGNLTAVKAQSTQRSSLWQPNTHSQRGWYSWRSHSLGSSTRRHSCSPSPLSGPFEWSPQTHPTREYIGRQSNSSCRRGVGPSACVGLLQTALMGTHQVTAMSGRDALAQDVPWLYWQGSGTQTKTGDTYMFNIHTIYKYI